MITLTIVGVYVVCLAAIAFIVPFSVFGRLLKESELDTYFEKHLDDYEVNTRGRRMFHGDYSKEVPFIGSLSMPVYSRWYIDEYGQIPRWSKWSKVLDNRYKRQLTKVPKQKELVEL